MKCISARLRKDTTTQLDVQRRSALFQVHSINSGWGKESQWETVMRGPIVSMEAPP